MKTCNKGLHQYPVEHKQCKECGREANRAWYRAHKNYNRAKTKSWQQENPGKALAKRKRYEATKLKRTPPWLTQEQLHSIELFYLSAKWVESILEEPIHVDHIVPLQGEEVSGLHVPWNLQLLTAKENTSKGNKLKTSS